MTLTIQDLGSLGEFFGSIPAATTQRASGRIPDSLMPGHAGDLHP